MATLSEVRDGDWKGFRRMARRYQRELRRIRDATAVPADSLRRFAAEALAPSRRKKNGNRAAGYDD